MEKARLTAFDLLEAQGSLVELRSRHEQYKDNRKDLDEDLRKANLVLVAKHQRLTEKMNELATTQAEIARLRA